MNIFPAEKEVKLTLAKAEFRDALLANDLFARVVVTCIGRWQVDSDPNIETLMQPSIMPGAEVGMPDAIVGGVQVGFRKDQGKSRVSTWNFIDLFAYRPPAPGYTVMPDTPVVSAAPSAEVSELMHVWKTSIGQIVSQFGEHDLRINRYTGEIDLRENIYEGKMPILLPIDE